MSDKNDTAGRQVRQTERTSDEQRRPPSPRGIGAMVERVLAARKLTHGVFEARVFQAFSDSVGPSIAKHAKPIRVRGTELTVSVDSASWRQQLQFLAADLVSKTNTKFGKNVLQSLRLVFGEKPTIVPLPPEEKREQVMRDATPEELTQADALSKAIPDGEIASLFARSYLLAKQTNRTK